MAVRAGIRCRQACVIGLNLLLLICFVSPGLCAGEHPVPESQLWLTYEGGEGPGRGKHVVLIAAEQEYRSEYAMPMLARLLAKHHGFHCTVLFSVNGRNEVDPTQKIRWEDKTVMHRIPGLEHLKSCDLLIVFSRLLSLAPEQLQHVYEYLDSGRPIVGIRTANHGFLDFEYRKAGKRVDFGEHVLGGSLGASPEALQKAKQKLRLATAVQMSLPGSPTVYYGDEVGVTGGDDPYNRMTYPWADLGGQPDMALRADFKVLLKLRQDKSVLRRGVLSAPLISTASSLVLTRHTPTEQVLMAFNNSEQIQTHTFKAPPALLKQQGAMWWGKGTVTLEGPQMTVSIPPLSAWIWGSTQTR